MVDGFGVWDLGVRGSFDLQGDCGLGFGVPPNNHLGSGLGFMVNELAFGVEG